MASLSDHLLGPTRSAVLAQLLLHPEASLHVRELARVTGASAGSLHRELRTLADLGVLRRREVGRQVHYQANTENPVFAELAGLLRKTAGVADVLREAVATLGERVRLAFVFGSVAAGVERPGSDVDLMVLGPAGFGDVVRAIGRTREALRREVNPVVMTSAEFASKLSAGDAFVSNVAKSPKLWLIGGEDDIAELAADRPPQGAPAHARRNPAPARRSRSKSRRRRG